MNDLKHISKFLSLVLRHKPEEIGISMDSEGWVDVKELLEKCSAKKRYINLQLLQQIVNTNDKQRFAFNHDHTKIRASQGHTVAAVVGDHVAPEGVDDLARFLCFGSCHGFVLR